MNAAHGHPRGHATCSYELVSCPSSPPASHRRRERGPKSERLRRFALGLAPYLLCSKKRRCHGHGGAARGLPLPGVKGERRGRAARAPGALARNHLQALHWRLVAYLNCPSPASSLPHQRVPFMISSVERSAPSRASRCWGGNHICCVAPRSSPGPACLVFDGMSVQARRLDAVL